MNLPNSEASGIYQIYRKDTGEDYIGRAAKLRTRCRQHLNNLKANRHVNAHLQNVYNKYGEGILEFKVLEICGREETVEKEKQYIREYNPTFNAERPTYEGIWFHTEETKQKLRGPKHSKEFKNRMRERMTGNRHPLFGKHHSEETLLKMSVNHKKKVCQINQKTGEIIKIWDSATDVEKELNIFATSVIRCCKGYRNTKQAGGFGWKYYQT